MITIQIYMLCYENGLLFWVSLPDTDDCAEDQTGDDG